MGKLTLKAAPTFSAPVKIPVPGGEAAVVRFEFKHRTRDACEKWLKEVVGRSDPELILEMALAWELAEPFELQHLEELVQNYGGAARAILDVYLTELAGARLGN